MPDQYIYLLSAATVDLVIFTGRDLHVLLIERVALSLMLSQ
jgi:hypothetical protein